MTQKNCKHNGIVRTDGETFVDCQTCGKFMTMDDYNKKDKRKWYPNGMLVEDNDKEESCK